MKKSIVENIKQLLLIVFSVVLGLFLSERIEERKKEKEADLLLSKLKLEIIDNKKILENWVPYHQEMVNRLGTLIEDETFINKLIEDKSSFFEELLTKGSLMGTFPANDAWDIAKSHPLIVFFDYEDLLILSKIYNQQEMTYASIPDLIQLLLSADFNTRENAKPNLQEFRNQMREVVSREIQLMNYFKEAEITLELQKN